MKNKFNSFFFTKKLSALGERQGKIAIQASVLIENTLKDFNINYSVEVSESFIPKTNSVSLIADGKNIPCKSTAFKSGVISGKENIISSLIPSRFLIDEPNINFNPSCDGISRSNFYFSPSVAINRKDLPVVVNAESVRLKVSIKKIAIKNRQILVGNRKNPDTIIFSHYDSIGPGAIDNASGVSTAIGAIIKSPSCLDRVLFVFDGNEELSYDYPTYWGKGFRDFEKKHPNLLEACEKIIVVDCVGNGKPVCQINENISYLAFPVKNVKKWSSKIFNLSGDIGDLMKVYHSDLDTPNKIKNHFLELAINLLSKKLL